MQPSGLELALLTAAGKAFFALISRNFEQAFSTGTVQLVSEEPALAFFITVERSSIECTGGVTACPTATIVMRNNVICDLVSKADTYDSRVVEFSSRLSLSGNVELANLLLNLVKRPSGAVMRSLEQAKEVWRPRAIDRIQRVHCPDEGFIREAIKDFRPILMTGVLDEWTVSAWSPEALRAQFGRYQVVSYSPGTLQNYTDRNTPMYTVGVGLPGVLWNRFRSPTVLDKAASLGFPQLWLGSPGATERAVTSLHCDCVHGFLCHVYGQKKVTLYSPDQESLLYPVRAFNMFRSCQTGPDAIDYEKYPLFRHARPVEVLLNPGDVLLIPLGWFHCVFAIGSVMSISYPLDERQLHRVDTDRTGELVDDVNIRTSRA